MNAGAVKQVAIGFVLLFATLFSSITVYAATETTAQDGFTAVAGTENVVIDRREKNNTTIVSGFLLALLVLLAVGALKHTKSKRIIED